MGNLWLHVALIRPLLLRTPYLTTLGPKMQLSNISVKYSKENSISWEVSKIWEYWIKIGRVHCGLRFKGYTHWFPHSEQKHNISHLRDSKLQKN